MTHHYIDSNWYRSDLDAISKGDRVTFGCTSPFANVTLPGVTELTSLDAGRPMVLHMPDLKVIRGDLELDSGARLVAPVLTKIEGRIDLAQTKFFLPELRVIGDYFNLDGLRYGDIQLPKLEKMSGEKLAPPEERAELLRRVAEAGLQAGALNMGAWHHCKTTHCVAGWAIHLSGQRGKKLEEKYSAGVAGAILLGPEMIPRFYQTDATAKRWMRGLVG